MAKRLVAVSDSHGAAGSLRDVVNLAMSRGIIDVFVFLGDGIGDALALKPALLAHNPELEWIAVRGNNDPYQSAPEEAFFPVNGRGVLAVHGHGYHVKLGTRKLLYTAREKGANLALYGHTHQSHLGEAYGVVLVNPGAVCEAFTGRPVWADILIGDDGSIRARLVSRAGEEW